MPVSPIELLARREGLGLSMHEMASWLGTREGAVSKWQRGRQELGDEFANAIDAAEILIETLADEAFTELRERHAGGVSHTTLYTYSTDDELSAAHPELTGVPAVFHRVAMARARTRARVHGLTVTIEPGNPNQQPA